MSERKDGANKKSRKNANKVRVKLPGIESYEKTLEFAAEGPGRVVVRLERLMGSDRIRITDPKYLSTLVERLEAEEDQSWGSRSRFRKKAEKNRSRQLAIEGLMEPTEDMQDLYEHPVFRVNRVLNRLATFDSNFTGDTRADKVPPIIPVEPFIDDLSGKVFKSYPQHQIFHRDVLPYDTVEYRSRMSTMGKGNAPKTSRATVSHFEDTLPASKTSHTSIISSPSKTEMTTASGVKSTKSLYRKEAGTAASSQKPSDLTLSAKSSTKISKRREDDDQDDDDSEADRQQIYFGKPESLKDFRRRYEVPSDVDLVKDWDTFKSHLVNRVYEDSGLSAEDLYILAGSVIGTYDRQLDTVDNFMTDHEEKVKSQRRAMGLPSDPNVVVNQPEPEGGENEEEQEGDEADEDLEMLEKDEDEDEEEIEVDKTAEDELEEDEDAADNEAEEDNAEE